MSWPGATAVFLAYIVIAAWTRRDVQRQVRWRVTALAAIAIAGTAGAHALPAGVLRHWIVPPIFLLAAYWTSGLLFVRPMPRAGVLMIRIRLTESVLETASFRYATRSLISARW